MLTNLLHPIVLPGPDLADLFCWCALLLCSQVCLSVCEAEDWACLCVSLCVHYGTSPSPVVFGSYIEEHVSQVLRTMGRVPQSYRVWPFVALFMM